MKYVVCNGYRKKKLKIYLALIIIVIMMINDVKITKASNNRDYLNITLADIIITWYNASGTAIGNQNLFNAIQTAYGNITLEDLVDNDVIVTNDITATKEDIKNAIGYGSYSVPYLKVNHRNLMQYCGGLPTDDAARESLTAMFSWTNNPNLEGIFSAISIAVGNVVNLGKIGFNFTKDVLVDTLNNTWLVNTLRDVYHNFTDSTYFHEYMENNGIGTGTSNVIYDGWQLTNVPQGYENYQWGSVYMNVPYNVMVVFVVENTYLVVNPEGTITRLLFANANAQSKYVYVDYGGTIDVNSKTIRCTGNVTQSHINPTSMTNYVGLPSAYQFQYTIGYAVKGVENNASDIIAKNPWGQISDSSGITDYVNEAVGNITNQNYQDLSSNIEQGQYIYIINRNVYQNIINEINNNNNNEDYSQNADVINNNNITYIQVNTSYDERPTMVPAPTGQPVQPFISPRPTPIPEETDNAIYNGGISESIKDKFPFCIPWDIQAMVNNLWSSERRAPYIHWDANFGTWGKLGEVNIDLSPYDTAAAIFRSTTLLLWIIGLVLITRNIIGS